MNRFAKAGVIGLTATLASCSPQERPMEEMRQQQLPVQVQEPHIDFAIGDIQKYAAAYGTPYDAKGNTKQFSLPNEQNNYFVATVGDLGSILTDIDPSDEDYQLLRSLGPDNTQVLMLLVTGKVLYNTFVDRDMDGTPDLGRMFSETGEAEYLDSTNVEKFKHEYQRAARELSEIIRSNTLEPAQPPEPSIPEPKSSAHVYRLASL